MDSQDAVLEFAVDILGIDVFADRKRPIEVTDVVLVEQVVELRLPRRALAVDGQLAALKLNVQVVRPDARHVGKHNQLIRQFDNVAPWRETDSTASSLRIATSVRCSFFTSEVSAMGNLLSL
jgi:hypothetical protein